MRKPPLVTFEAPTRLVHGAVRQSGETYDAHIDADGIGRRVNRSVYFAAGLDRDEPPASAQGHRGISELPQHLSRQPQANPAELW